MPNRALRWGRRGGFEGEVRGSVPNRLLTRLKCCIEALFAHFCTMMRKLKLSAGHFAGKKLIETHNKAQKTQKCSKTRHCATPPFIIPPLACTQKWERERERERVLGPLGLGRGSNHWAWQEENDKKIRPKLAITISGGFGAEGLCCKKGKGHQNRAPSLFEPRVFF